MSHYLGAIFDLDGTLVNTIADIGNSMNAALRTLGFPEHSLEEYRLKVGGGFGLLVERSLPEGSSDTLKQTALAELSAVYDAHHMDESTPYPGVVNLLEALQDAGIPIAINTNKRDDYAKELAAHFFPTIQFVDVVGQQERFGTKPHPAGALAIAEQMQIPVEHLIFIGDSDVDIITGANANIDTIGVTWGFRSEAELRANNATYIAHNTDTIATIIREGK